MTYEEKVEILKDYKWPDDMPEEVRVELISDILKFGNCYYESTKTETYKVVLGTKMKYKRINPMDVEEKTFKEK